MNTTTTQQVNIKVNEDVNIVRADKIMPNKIQNLIALLLAVLVLILPFLVYAWSNSYILFVIIPIIMLYGLYLIMTDQAVLYASKQDLFNTLCIFSVPIAAFIALLIAEHTLDLTLNINILIYVIAGSALISVSWFGLKTANVNSQVNGVLPQYQQITILFTKIVLVLLTFLVLFFYIFNQKESKTKKTAKMTLAALILFWIYSKSINIEAVMERRRELQRR